MDPSPLIPPTLRQWHPAPAVPVIEPDEVHIWRLALPDSASVESQNVLSEDEIAAANRFHFERDRNRYVACRADLRRILGQLTQTPPRQICLSYASHGKPYLSSNDQGLRFNVSHSKDTALIAVAMDNDLGVDVECIETDVDHNALAQHFFTEGERRFIASLDAARRPHAFYQCWTRKEAWIKAVGGGLTLPLDHFDVAASLGQPQTIVRETHGQSVWTMLELNPDAQKVGALVTHPAIKTIRQWCYPPQGT
ncbi:MAG TPA: 4'-phosphopantetheinyl transferase superfamily protein [Tepidisphaeraceae bacterium]|jgi:4'-phosphopantetheinyl transferase